MSFLTSKSLKRNLMFYKTVQKFNIVKKYLKGVREKKGGKPLGNYVQVALMTVCSKIIRVLEINRVKKLLPNVVI